VEIITYITSDGQRLDINSGMPEAEIANIQAQFWKSYGPDFHPRQQKTQEVVCKLRKRNNHHETFHQHR